jgi:hypothetical protein
MPSSTLIRDASSVVHFHTAEDAPHLVVELSGPMTHDAVCLGFDRFLTVLSSLPPQFVLLATYPDVPHIDPDAVGPLFSVVVRLFDAEPSLCVFVDGGRSLHPGLRNFITRVGGENRIAFVPTIDDAIDRIGGTRPSLRVPLNL